jgi:hypothetical protein
MFRSAYPNIYKTSLPLILPGSPPGARPGLPEPPIQQQLRPRITTSAAAVAVFADFQTRLASAALLSFDHRNTVTSDLHARVDSLQTVAETRYCLKHAIERARRRRLRRRQRDGGGGAYVWMSVRPLVLFRTLVWYSAASAAFDVFLYEPLMHQLVVLGVLLEETTHGSQIAHRQKQQQQQQSHLIAGRSSAMAAQRPTPIHEKGWTSMSLKRQTKITGTLQGAKVHTPSGMARDRHPKD